MLYKSITFLLLVVITVQKQKFIQLLFHFLNSVLSPNEHELFSKPILQSGLTEMNTVELILNKLLEDEILVSDYSAVSADIAADIVVGIKKNCFYIFNKINSIFICDGLPLFVNKHNNFNRSNQFAICC